MSRRFLSDAASADAGDSGLVEEQDPLSTLLDVGQILSSQLDLLHALESVLLCLERERGVARGAVMALDEQSGEIRIEVSRGFGPEARRARFRLGEGLAGRVIQTGTPVVVPAMGREPLFLHSDVERGADQTFICVPISTDGKTAGALAVEVDSRTRPETATRFLRVVAAMIAQAFQARRSLGESGRRLLEENSALLGQLRERHGFSSIVGSSAPMRQVREQVALAAPTDGTVLLQGEPGTGKELIARALHYGSPRARRPFVKVALGALPKTLAESILFGREAGATGQSPRRGRVELAEGGTLFLDEVGELSGGAQARLVRCLQDRAFERLGGTATVRMDVRLIASTGRDLEAKVASRSFREDLYYRLCVVPIFLPALRDRKGDIVSLVDQFIARHSQQHRKAIRRIAGPALDLLLSHHWPGNVRELEDAVEHAVLACDSDAIHGQHLPPSLQGAGATGATVPTSLGGAVSRYERDLILDALKSARGSIAAAARVLSTTERIIGYKIRKYRIDPLRYRPRGPPPAGSGDPS